MNAKIYLLSGLALAMLAACNKNEVEVPGEVTVEVSEIRLPSDASSSQTPTTTPFIASQPWRIETSAPKSGAKAKILNSSTLKLIQSQKGSKAKAFLATFESGHSAIVQRQDGETYRRDGAKRQAKYGRHIDMTRIKKLLSISFPKMVGGSAVLGELAPDIYDTLLENVNKEIRRVMRT